MKHESRSQLAMRILYGFVLASFAVPIAFLIYKIVVTDRTEGAWSDAYRSRADYVLMLVECILGLIVIHIPQFFTKKLKMDIPKPLYVMYIVFLYCAIFLGEVRSFYYTVPHWDDILHSCSSIMTGMFGFMVVQILNKETKTVMHLSPFFVALFAFCFSLTIGSLWEIYEFTFDGLLGLNMQKFLLESGEPLVGRAALTDTMKDIIVDTLGALFSSTFGYICLKHNNGWIHDYYTRNENLSADGDTTDDKADRGVKHDSQR